MHILGFGPQQEALVGIRGKPLVMNMAIARVPTLRRHVDPPSQDDSFPALRASARISTVRTTGEILHSLAGDQRVASSGEFPGEAAVDEENPPLIVLPRPITRLRIRAELSWRIVEAATIETERFVRNQGMTVGRVKPDHGRSRLPAGLAGDLDLELARRWNLYL